MRNDARRRCVFGVALFCAYSLCLAQGRLERDRPTNKDDEIGIAYEYVWGAESAFGSFLPIRIEVDNPLDDDRGVVTLRSDTYVVRYPIEMPSKSLRSFIAYLPTTGYGDSEITLECRQARLRTTVGSVGWSNWEVFDVGLVSDSTSLLTFVKTLKSKQQSPSPNGPQVTQELTYRDYATLPEFAPDRSVGYQGLDLVVLAEGAERLGDAEVAAIQRYVLGGGAVLLTGGAVSPILKDPRWAPFLPGRPSGVVNREGSKALSDVGGVRLSGTLTLTQLVPDAGTTGLSEGGVPIFWYKRCGLGMCIYWAFDPFQSPVRTYPGRGKLFVDTLALLDKSGAEYANEIGAGSFSRDDYYSSAYRYTSYDTEESGVFRVVMPPASKIFLILALFFVVVVPLNFLVLARLGKGHLAWVTSPAIALAFASVFFYIARDLYGASLSRATTSIVVAHQGARVAYATGNQQLFFPSGGRYDLKFSGIESVTTTSDYYGMYSAGRSTGISEDLVDVGEVIAPSAGVNSLAFRELHFEQAVAWPYKTPLRLTMVQEGDLVRGTGVFTNDTPYGLLDATVWAGRSSISLGSVAAGQTVNVNGIAARHKGNARGHHEPPVSEGQVVLVATITGLGLGARIGKEEQSQSTVYLSFNDLSSKVAGR